MAFNVTEWSEIAWWHGIVVSIVWHPNKATLHRAQLLLGWVTIFGWVFHLDR